MQGNESMDDHITNGVFNSALDILKIMLNAVEVDGDFILMIPTTDGANSLFISHQSVSRVFNRLKSRIDDKNSAYNAILMAGELLIDYENTIKWDDCTHFGKILQEYLKALIYNALDVNSHGIAVIAEESGMTPAQCKAFQKL